MTLPIELELPKPFSKETLKEGTVAVEVLRVWIVDDKPIIVLKPEVFEDLRMWGFVLADLMHQLTEAFHKLKQLDVQATMNLLVGAMLEELRNPDQQFEGYIIQNDKEPS